MFAGIQSMAGIGKANKAKITILVCIQISIQLVPKSSLSSRTDSLSSFQRNCKKRTWKKAIEEGFFRALNGLQ